MARHYLDYASSAPLRPEAARAIAHALERRDLGDPSRPYHEGRSASAAIEAAREQVARMLGVEERCVIFTSSGTEAANLANFAARAQSDETRPILCSGAEHASVRRSAAARGPVLELAVDTYGRVDLAHLKALLEQSPALVHCQFANHEVGTRQPVEEVVELCRDAGVLVHVDACMMIGQARVDLGALGADFVSLSAHKFGGPPGVGALVVRRGRRVPPLLVGAEQERARRAGFENTLGIIGLGAACEALCEGDVLEVLAARARADSDELLAAALSVDGVVAFGDTERRAPHLVCVSVPGVEVQGVVIGLDQANIAVHSGSACSSEAFEPSPVLAAMGLDAEHSLRLSVGWTTSRDDLGAFAQKFPEVVAELRSLA